jgi:hypothetical protein
MTRNSPKLQAAHAGHRRNPVPAGVRLFSGVNSRAALHPCAVRGIFQTRTGNCPLEVTPPGADSSRATTIELTDLRNCVLIAVVRGDDKTFFSPNQPIQRPLAATRHQK